MLTKQLVENSSDAAGRTIVGIGEQVVTHLELHCRLILVDLEVYGCRWGWKTRDY